MTDEIHVATDTSSQESEKISERGTEVTPEDKILQIAKKAGWREGGTWDAETFLEKKAVQAIEQNKELKNIKRMVETNNRLVSETIKQKVQEQLAIAEDNRDEAIKRGDVAQVKAIDKQIREIEKQTPGGPEVREEVKEFISRHPWFDVDKKMTRRAVAFKDEYFADNPDGTWDDALEYAENELKQAFPDKFKKAESEEKLEKKPAASAVESASAQTSNTQAWQGVKAKMSGFEKEAMMDMVKQIQAVNPKYTEKDYIEAYMTEGRKQA